ncbi:hypothetical protein BOVAC1_974 [Bacteroides ovatus]|nr:hypothetical protein BOVAC1_974 [Bacteroides ovatus]
MFSGKSNWQQYAFICRDMRDVRVTHITRLGSVKVVKTF